MIVVFFLQVQRKDLKMKVISGKGTLHEGVEPKKLQNKRLHIDTVLSDTSGVQLFFSCVGYNQEKKGRRDRRTRKYVVLFVIQYPKLKMDRVSTNGIIRYN